MTRRGRPAATDRMPHDRSSSQSGVIPRPLRRFIALFNRERFWESHEALEDAWRAGESGFYHGLILLASAYVHVLRRNPHGVLAQLEKAGRCLEEYRPAYLGIDVDALLAEAERLRGIVSRLHTGSEDLWEDVPLPRLDIDPAAVRGDEPELALDA